MLCYVQMADPELLPAGRYPSLEAFSQRCEARPEFRATYPVDYALPRAREDAALRRVRFTKT